MELKVDIATDDTGHGGSTVKWNTGRPYTIRGQELSALMLPTHHIKFADHSRHIYGITHDPLPSDWPLTHDSVRVWTMQQYDDCTYTSTNPWF